MSSQSVAEPPLSDPEVFPSEKVIAAYLGKYMPLWVEFTGHLHEMSLVGEWRYYRDGKRWLFKANKKARTICWSSLIEGSFRVTCYFGAKAADAIAKSDLPDELKMQYSEGKRYGKIRAITVPIKRKRDMKAVRELLAVKELAK